MSDYQLIVGRGEPRMPYAGGYVGQGNNIYTHSDQYAAQQQAPEPPSFTTELMATAQAMIEEAETRLGQTALSAIDNLEAELQSRRDELSAMGPVAARNYEQALRADYASAKAVADQYNAFERREAARRQTERANVRSGLLGALRSAAQNYRQVQQEQMQQWMGAAPPGASTQNLSPMDMGRGR